MRYNVHAGHGLSGGIGCGASERILIERLNSKGEKEDVRVLTDESIEDRKIAAAVINYLKMDGNTVHDCTVNKNEDPRKILQEIVAKCNSNYVDLGFSIHINCDDSPNANGSECLLLSTGGNKEKLAAAERICKNLENLGFRNRGIKIRKDLYYLNESEEPACLVECFFLQNKHDVELYRKLGPDTLGKAIAEGIVGHTIVTRNSAVYNTKLSVGDKLEVIKTIQIRSNATQEYKRRGVFYEGMILKVLQTSTDGKRVRVGRNMWVSTHKDYIRQM